MREMVDFLKNVYQESDLGIKSKGRQISSSDAKLAILLLLERVVPNLKSAPAFNPKEVQNLFAVLHYPYTIRADSITAVGAPSSVAFLVKAIYWLYLAVRTYHKRTSQNNLNLSICKEELDDSILES